MESPHKHPPGLSHAWRATSIAFQGLSTAWKCEDAFRQEVILSVILIPLAFWLAATPIQAVLMVSAIIFVLIVELINSAVEAAVDHTSLERHPLAKRAKDIASAAVFLSIMNALLVWGIVLFTIYFA